MDVDGDGVLSMYELEYFYTEQVSKMDALGIETMVFQDCLCQVWVWIVWPIQFQSHPPKNFKNYAFNSVIIIHTLIVLMWRNCLTIKSFYTL